jgi:hypothetical protein
MQISWRLLGRSGNKVNASYADTFHKRLERPDYHVEITAIVRRRIPNDQSGDETNSNNVTQESLPIL